MLKTVIIGKLQVHIRGMQLWVSVFILKRKAEWYSDV